MPDPEEMPRRTDDSHLAERLDALLALLELAGLDLDADGLQLMVKVRDGVLRAGVVPDDEAAQRLACLAAPSDCTLTLVRDTCAMGKDASDTGVAPGRLRGHLTGKFIRKLHLTGR